MAIRLRAMPVDCPRGTNGTVRLVLLPVSSLHERPGELPHREQSPRKRDISRPAGRLG